MIEDIGCNIRNLLTAAVEKRLMSDRRIGCLLSGGLDSSLISAILVKLTKEKNIPYRVQVNIDQIKIRSRRMATKFLKLLLFISPSLSEWETIVLIF